jgi:hypothetical protein
MLACIAISIVVRSIGATKNPQCPGIDTKALAIHEDIVAKSRYAMQTIKIMLLIRPKNAIYYLILLLIAETRRKTRSINVRIV